MTKLKELIEQLKKKKQEAVDEFTCEDLAHDDNTALDVELTFGDIDQIVEIISAFIDASEDDEDWDEDE